MADSESDIDRRGFYLPPAKLHWSLYGVPEQLECHETQEAYWEIQKFMVLALKANPNVLECLYTPDIPQGRVTVARYSWFWWTFASYEGFRPTGEALEWAKETELTTSDGLNSIR